MKDQRIDASTLEPYEDYPVYPGDLTVVGDIPDGVTLRAHGFIFVRDGSIGAGCNVVAGRELVVQGDIGFDSQAVGRRVHANTLKANASVTATHDEVVLEGNAERESEIHAKTNVQVNGTVHPLARVHYNGTYHVGSQNCTPDKLRPICHGIVFREKDRVFLVPKGMLNEADHQDFFYMLQRVKKENGATVTPLKNDPDYECSIHAEHWYTFCFLIENTLKKYKSLSEQDADKNKPAKGWGSR